MDGNNHYVRVDANNIVIHAFSDAFETPLSTDILVESNSGRQYNPQLMNDRSQFIYKVVSGAMTLRTQAELDAEWASRPAPPPSESDRLASVESALISLMGL
jgi:hypothetical protein